MTHRLAVRVYYEDTDLAGIVYYANYLKFIERGRSEWLRDLNIDQMALKAEHGIVFAVRRLEADYIRPAKFGEDLTVTTSFNQISGARLLLNQSVWRGEDLLFEAVVTLVCIGASGLPARLPLDVKAAFTAAAH